MRILYVEPFEGGSHASFSRAIEACVPAAWTRLTLPGRHWKWRMRGSAVWAALDHADALRAGHDLLWASSYVPLAELVGLAPALATRPRLLYFHENQLAFPWRDETPAERDLHYGMTQLVSALAATCCVFNSAFNRDSFLDAGRELLARMPDAVPHDWVDRIAARSRVLGVPMSLPDEAPPIPAPDPAGPTILWNHRWEHDKNPESCFAALERLADADVAFRVVVCGQRFRRTPKVFERAQARLGSRIVHWGFSPTQPAYIELLTRSDVAVSTARHEFFGLAMLEATHYGAYPLVPDRLAYRELFPETHRYPDTDDDASVLAERLEGLCRRYAAGEVLRADRRAITSPHRIEALGPRYRALVSELLDAES